MLLDGQCVLPASTDCLSEDLQTGEDVLVDLQNFFACSSIAAEASFTLEQLEDVAGNPLDRVPLQMECYTPNGTDDGAAHVRASRQQS